MTRQEYNEFRYIRSYAKKGYSLSYGTLLTIPVDASRDYKRRLHDLYTEWGFHPSAVRTDPYWFDDRERIIYTYGLHWTYNSEETRSWKELFTPEEHARFSAALEK